MYVDLAVPDAAKPPRGRVLHQRVVLVEERGHCVLLARWRGDQGIDSHVVGVERVLVRPPNPKGQLKPLVTLDPFRVSPCARDRQRPFALDIDEQSAFPCRLGRQRRDERQETREQNQTRARRARVPPRGALRSKTA